MRDTVYAARLKLCTPHAVAVPTSVVFVVSGLFFTRYHEK